MGRGQGALPAHTCKSYFLLVFNERPFKNAGGFSFAPKKCLFLCCSRETMTQSGFNSCLGLKSMCTLTIVKYCGDTPNIRFSNKLTLL